MKDRFHILNHTAPTTTPTRITATELPILCLSSMLADRFSSCVLTPWTGADVDEILAGPLECRNGKWSLSSFYSDSTGRRATVSLPLHLRFASPGDLTSFLANNSIHPAPAVRVPEASSSIAKDSTGVLEQTIEQQQSTTEEVAPSQAESSLLVQSPPPPPPHIAIEAKVNLTVGTGRALAATVEGVTVTSSELVEDETGSTIDSVVLHTEIELVIARAKGVEQSESDMGFETSTFGGETSSGVKINLEITATYWEPKHIGNCRLEKSTVFTARDTALKALQTGLRRTFINHPDDWIGPATRLKPLSIHILITHALSMHVRSIPGPFPGKTFLAVTIRHTNTHSHDLMLTNITLHPRRTRWVSSSKETIESLAPDNLAVVPLRTHTFANREHYQRQDKVSDMSSFVNWGFVDSANDPYESLTLKPNEAHAIILSVDAVGCDDDMHLLGYFCCCSLSVTAELTTVNRKGLPNRRPQLILVHSDALWTTRRASTELTDSIRVDMSLHKDGTAESPLPIVGEPIAVDLEIVNLSSELLRLILVVNTGKIQNNNQWTISSDLEGYQFSVGGPDIGIDEQHLLRMDNALLLGELKGGATVKAQLRLIPLREGTLSIPNFKLVDGESGKSYLCCHHFNAVAVAST